MSTTSTRSLASKILGLLALLVIAAVTAYFRGGSTDTSASKQPVPVTQPVDKTSTGQKSPVSSKVAVAPPERKLVEPAPGHAADVVPASIGSDLRIGAWNIEWLGKPEDRSGAAKGIAQDPRDLADCINASNVAVLALEEIVAAPGRPLRSSEIEATIEVLSKKTSAKWDYVLFPGRAEGDQLTGIMWNTGKVTALNQAGKPWQEFTDEAWALPIPKARSASGSALWNRPPHAVKFTTGDGLTDFVTTVIHMKADYNGDFAAHRQEEAAALVRALTAVRTKFKDEDIVILGDSNCVGEHEPAIIELEKADYFDLNARHTQTHWQGGTMDRALVPTRQPEFEAHQFEVMSDRYLRDSGLTPRDYKRRYSDHYMVVMTLKIMKDDD